MKMNLICFGYNPWSTLWKRNQIMVSLLVDTGVVNRALFINPGIRVADVAARFDQQFGSLASAKWRGLFRPEVFKNIWSYTPLYWPRRTANAHERLLKAIQTFDKRPYLLLVNRLPDLPSEMVQELISSAAAVVVDWSDDFQQFCYSAEEATRFASAYESIVKKANAVICVNRGLERRALQLNPRSFLIRNATALPLVGKVIPRGSRVSRRTHFPRHRQRAVVGYVGWLVANRLNHDIISTIASGHRDCDFVFVGPRVGTPLPNEILKLPNVHVRKPVPFHALEDVLTGFDVNILPNRINAYTNGNDPIKIFDYLYCGRPIVATPTEGTQEFSQLLHLADDGEMFSRALECALGDTASDARRAAGFENSWLTRFISVENVFRDLVC
jgi:glycosyltransferase involved in cell wall biosynthesis